MLTVLYRLSGSGNTQKLRPVDGGKLPLIRVCYKSFLNAFKEVKPKVHFIVDKPTIELVDLLEECPFEHTLETVSFPDFNTGNTGTFHKQLDMAAEIDGKVLLLEDDYYFLPDAGPIIDDALDTLGFLTPYDHPGYYTEDTHNYRREVVVAGGRHWQTVISTCLTFATWGENIRDEIDNMKSYGWADHPMWVDLTKRYDLWSPIPTLATHMETPYLSYNIDWRFDDNRTA